jgi:hypothetical protein
MRASSASRAVRPARAQLRRDAATGRSRAAALPCRSPAVPVARRRKRPPGWLGTWAANA